jgi:hypothetical protein
MQEASAEIKKQAQEGKCWDAVERNSSCRTTPTGQAMKTACHSSHDAIARCGSRYLSRVQQPFDTTPTLMARETKVSRIIDSMSGDKSPSLRSFELSDKARRHRQRAASTPKEMFVVTQSAQAGRQTSDTQSRRCGPRSSGVRVMLKDPRSARGFRSTGQLEKGIGADRSTTERLLLAVGAKSTVAEEWTLGPL